MCELCSFPTASDDYNDLVFWQAWSLQKQKGNQGRSRKGGGGCTGGAESGAKDVKAQNAGVGWKDRAQG